MKIEKNLSPIMESISNVGKKKTVLKEEVDPNYDIVRALDPAAADAVDMHREFRKQGLERRENALNDPLIKEFLEETASDESRTRHIDVKDRKELAKVLTEAKKKKQKFKVGKSDKSGYRYFVDIIPVYGSKGALDNDNEIETDEDEVSDGGESLGESLKGEDVSLQKEPTKEEKPLEEDFEGELTYDEAQDLFYNNERVQEQFDYWEVDHAFSVINTVMRDISDMVKEFGDDLYKEKEDSSSEELNEDLQVYTSTLKDFKPAKEAEELWDEIIEKNKLDDLEYGLENVFKSKWEDNTSIDIEGLNDLLINHQDFIRTLLDLDGAPLEDKDYDDDFDEEPVEDDLFDDEDEIEDDVSDNEEDTDYKNINTIGDNIDYDDSEEPIDYDDEEDEEDILPVDDYDEYQEYLDIYDPEEKPKRKFKKRGLEEESLDESIEDDYGDVYGRKGPRNQKDVYKNKLDRIKNNKSLDHSTIKDLSNFTKKEELNEATSEIRSSSDYVKGEKEASKVLYGNKNAFGSIFGYIKDNKFTPVSPKALSREDFNGYINSLKDDADVEVCAVYQNNLDDSYKDADKKEDALLNKQGGVAWNDADARAKHSVKKEGVENDIESDDTDNDLIENIANSFIKNNYKENTPLNEDDTSQESHSDKILKEALTSDDDEVVDITDDEIEEALGMPKTTEAKKESEMEENNLATKTKVEECKNEEVK